MTKTKFQQKCFELFNTPETIASQLEELEKFHEDEVQRGKEEVRKEFEGKVEMMGYVDSNNIIRKLDEKAVKHIVALVAQSLLDRLHTVENKVGIEHRENV